MSSSAFSKHLKKLLQDADHLVLAHEQLRTGRRGRQWGLGALNRAVVVMCVSAWEAYVEEIIIESINAVRPAVGVPPGNWGGLNMSARSLIGRFNNPNVDQVRMVISDALGLPDITTFWLWRKCDAARARELLTEALRFRHQIAHGVNPRPVIHNSYASRLPGLFLELGKCTDAGIRHYLVNTLGVADPWPA